MADQWYYNHQGQEFGPVAAGEIKRLALYGNLKPDDLVWKAGTASRRPASQFKGLFSQVASGTPPPIPPDDEPPPIPPDEQGAMTPEIQEMALALKEEGATYYQVEVVIPPGFRPRPGGPSTGRGRGGSRPRRQ
jgi:hypothetical protein